MNSIVHSGGDRQDVEDLRSELQSAQEDLRVAEAELAQEQAAVNAFRMHARLMLDDLVDAISELRVEKQSLLTRLELHRHMMAGESPDVTDGPIDDRPPADDYAPLDATPTPAPRDKAAEKRLYRELARRFHPDLAESAAELAYRTSLMSAVNAAFTGGDIHTLYDLAGELEPGKIAELSVIREGEVRQLRERLLHCQRRRRKVARQLEVLRQDNTARLWRRAQELNRANDNWWVAVRQDLEMVRAHVGAEVRSLRAQLETVERVAAPSD